MANAILYARVSTDEQAAKGTSLPFQKERLHQFCEVAGNNVVAEFTEDFSAKNFEDRPEFKKILAYIKESKGLVEKLLVLRWDRFSRNAPEAYNMIAKLKKLGIEVNAIEQPIDFNIPEQKMMLSFYLTIPEIENDRRALNTTNGMRKNMREGRWVSTAPLGYKNARDSSNKPILVITDKAELVKKAFELFATGTYTIDVLRKEMVTKGLTLSRMPFWTMLRNPVYCGKIRVKAYAKELEEIVQGLHEPIISEELFNEVQFVLSGKKKLKAKATKTRVELPLRGYLICSGCGKNLTGSSSKGNGGKYFYYHCQPGCNERYNTELAHEHFEKWLDDISFKPEVAQLYVSIMEDVFKTNEGDRDAEIKKLQGEVTKKNEMLEKATKKLINEEIDRIDFKRVKDSLTKESIELQLRINELKKADSGFMEYSNYSLSLLSNLKHYYSTSTLENKQKMIGLIFPEKLVFCNNSYRTNEPNEVLEFLTSNSKGFGVGTKEKIAPKSDLSCVVAGIANATSYSWGLPNVWNGSSTNNVISSTAGTSGTLSVTANNTCGNSAVQTLSITVFGLPTVTASSLPDSICNGSSSIITASGANTYEWSNSNSNNSQSVSPTVNTSYTVTGTDVNNCTNTATVSVAVNQLPSLTYHQNPNEVCSNHSAFSLSNAFPTGGTYSGLGVTGNTFNPATAGTGTITITYSYTGVHNCTNTITQTIIDTTCSTSGLQILTAKNNQVTVYPNPNNGSFNINVNDNENTTIEIYNTVGQKVLAQVLQNNLTQLNLSDFSNGIYQIRVLENNNLVYQAKIVKQE